MPVAIIDCGTFELPAANPNDCVTVIQGELSKIYWTAYRKSVNDGFADQTEFDNPASWSSRVSNSAQMPTDTTKAPIRVSEIIGGLNAPEQTSTKIEGGREIYGKPNYTIPFKMHDVSAEMVGWIQQTQNKPGQYYRCWFASDSRMLGDVQGIKGTLKLDLIIPAELDGLWEITGSFKFKSVLPKVNISPVS